MHGYSGEHALADDSLQRQFGLERFDQPRDYTVLGIRPACSVNNNLYPANGVLNIPSLTAGCTCNYAPVSMACVPAGVAECGGAE